MIRWLKFNAVGAMGSLVQIGVLAVLLRFMDFHYVWATAIAVESAVIHNFAWHWRWTWADRNTDGIRPMATAFLRFNFSNGLISLSGTILCTAFLVGIVHMDPLLANILAFVPCWLLNFFSSDRFVFLPVEGDPS